MQTKDNEGLCYDPAYNRLLIAAKNKPDGDDQEKTKRLIYSFDLSKKALSSAPVYRLDTEDIAARAPAFDIPAYTLTKKGKKKSLNFRPASLAIHPLSDEIYIISAADRLLLVINRKGEIRHMEQLDPRRFAKAEGLTFLRDGTMIVTNEAAGKVPTLLLYKGDRQQTTIVAPGNR